MGSTGGNRENLNTSLPTLLKHVFFIAISSKITIKLDNSCKFKHHFKWLKPQSPYNSFRSLSEIKNKDNLNKPFSLESKILKYLL